MGKRADTQNNEAKKKQEKKTMKQATHQKTD